MSLFIAQFTLVTKWYPDRRERQPAIRLIEAASIDEAMDKLDDYFDARSDTYSVSYSTEDVTISEVIR